MSINAWEKPEWRAHLDQEGYAVHDRDHLMYTVTGPSGRLINCTFTLRGAKHAIKRDRRKQARIAARKNSEEERPRYWEMPRVYEEQA